jgi:hypothetical protein
MESMLRAAPEGTAFVSAGDIPRSVRPGRIFELPIYLDARGRSLGGYVLELAFDPEALEVQEIFGGSAPEFSEPPLSDEALYDSGTVRFAAVNLQSLHTGAGRLHVATVTFKVLEPLDMAHAPVTVSPISLKDTDGQALQPEGIFQPIPGGGFNVIRSRENPDTPRERSNAGPNVRGR